MKDIRTVNEDTTKKLELLDSQLKECTKFLNAIDNYMSDTHVKIDTVRGMVCNTCTSHHHHFFQPYSCYYRSLIIHFILPLLILICYNCN